MELDSVTIEKLRNSSNQFFRLGNEIQEEILTRVVGPVQDCVYRWEDWPDSKYADLRDDVHFGSDLGHKIGAALKAGNCKHAAQLCMFFKVKALSFMIARYAPPDVIPKFQEAFPWGCFSGTKLQLNVNAKRTYMDEWVWGYPGAIMSHVVINSNLGSEDLEIVIQAFENYHTYTISDAMMILENCECHKDRNPNVYVLAQKLVAIMSQKKLIYSEECRYGELIYPSMIQYHYSRTRSYPFVIPPPRWSRQAHRFLADKEFHQAARTIILMQKFRNEQFPLHKDLIDILLSYVFGGHVSDLEMAVINKLVKVLAVEHLTYAEQSYFCLAEGMCSYEGDSRRDILSDAIDLKEGIPIDKKRLKAYKTALESRIMGWSGCLNLQSRLKTRLERFEDGKYLQDFGLFVARYCKAQKIDLVDVHTGKYVFTQDDEDAIFNRIVAEEPMDRLMN
jgi:hypothetical protein